jgi:hypothetical protein
VGERVLIVECSDARHAFFCHPCQMPPNGQLWRTPAAATDLTDFIDEMQSNNAVPATCPAGFGTPNVARPRRDASGGAFVHREPNIGAFPLPIYAADRHSDSTGRLDATRLSQITSARCITFDTLH